MKASTSTWRNRWPSLGAKVKWVKTSWKTLTPDFASGKCDYCDGRYLRHAGRQKQVFFADKLDTDGKIRWCAAPT